MQGTGCIQGDLFVWGRKAQHGAVQTGKIAQDPYLLQSGCPQQGGYGPALLLADLVQQKAAGGQHRGVKAVKAAVKAKTVFYYEKPGNFYRS